jgi:subtilisin family serine protease
VSVLRAATFVCLFATVSGFARPSHAQMGGGADLVRLLGPRALEAYARPGDSGIAALVALPDGVRASDVGLREVAPRFGRLFGPPSAIVAFGAAHPELPIEVVPPLHLLLDKAAGYVAATAAIAKGYDGAGVVIGIADTGLDVTHPDFLDASGNTRVAWLIDYSQPPRGVHADLEAAFASSGGAYGAVWSAADIDALLQSDKSQLPQDEVGHGTLVASCAAGNGELGKSPYRGIAPGATLVFARISPQGSSDITSDDLTSAVAFLFNRADAMGLPIVVNLSLGTDFGPHDGTTAWEQSLASYVGPGNPGHALVVAAGNSGSIADTPIHQNVYVPSGATVTVPIATQGAQNGGVQVWVAMHPGASLKVGLDGPDGQWIDLVGSGDSAGKSAGGYTAGIYNGSQAGASSAEGGSLLPTQSNGAVVVWQGQWPTGKYAIELSGEGTADLFLEGTGDASANVGFYDGVREGTVDLPATSASILAVGCTINKSGWVNVYKQPVSLVVPPLDDAGGEPLPVSNVDALPPPQEGEPCWFSAAGPTLTGLAKPEIMAPGAAIVGAMSQQAPPSSAISLLYDPLCVDQGQPDCQQIDPLHAVSFGTSFSSPIAAGAVAVLFQHDPTLTQDQVVAALQGGAHPLRAPAQFSDQAGAGEVDVLGALTALDAAVAMPSIETSWMVLGADVLLADGSTPLQAILELRAAPPATGAPAPADGFDASRLQAYARVDGKPWAGAVQSLVRRGPGVWVATLSLPAGLGGSNLTVGATFDGQGVVTEQTVPIATDTWNASYAPSIAGGCSVSGVAADDVAWWALAASSVAVLERRRRHGREARRRHA